MTSFNAGVIGRLSNDVMPSPIAKVSIFLHPSKAAYKIIFVSLLISQDVIDVSFAFTRIR